MSNEETTEKHGSNPCRAATLVVPSSRQAPPELERVAQQRQVREIFVATNGFLAFHDGLQRNGERPPTCLQFETEFLPLGVTEQAERAEEVLVQVPPFVRAGGEAAGEEDLFRVAQPANAAHLLKELWPIFEHVFGADGVRPASVTCAEPQSHRPFAG